MEDLETAIRLLRKREGANWCGLVVSGDVTASGDASEFVQALSFLHQRVRASWNESRGLEALFDHITCVPGDQDYAGGAHPGPTSSYVASYVRRMFFPPAQGNHWWLHHVQRLPSFWLQICGIDACGSNTKHYRKGGWIESAALAELLNAVKSAGKPEGKIPIVRVLVLHQSPAHAGAPAGAAPTPPPMGQQCRDQLRDFCRKADIHFVLSGQTHEPLLPTVMSPGGTEIRCGTTLQRLPQTPHSGHTFMAHLLTRSNHAVAWETRLYQRSPRGRFLVVKPSFRTTVP
jgi:hypothetical protein